MTKVCKLSLYHPGVALSMLIFQTMLFLRVKTIIYVCIKENMLKTNIFSEKLVKFQLCQSYPGYVVLQYTIYRALY